MKNLLHYTQLKQLPYRLKPEEYLERLRLFVKEKYNGELLSNEWQGYKKTLYKFRDTFGTEFEQTAENILHKKLWTPNRGLMAEPITRQVFEHLFQNKFEKNTSLLNKKVTGLECNYLELDGYNESLKIAFEYQGFPSHWNKKHPEYEQTTKRDKFKKILCTNLGIMLIQIPRYSDYDLRHFEDTNILKHIVKQIKKEYKKSDISLLDLNTDNFQIDFTILNHGKEKISIMKNMAEEHNGILISTEYKGRLYKYQFYDIESKQIFEITWKELKQYGYPKRFQRKDDSTRNDNISDKYLSSNNIENKTESLTEKEISSYTIKHHKLKQLQNIAKIEGFQLLSTEWQGTEQRYIFISNENKYYAINYQWITKFGFPDNTVIERFIITTKQAKKYLIY